MVPFSATTTASSWTPAWRQSSVSSSADRWTLLSTTASLDNWARHRRLLVRCSARDPAKAWSARVLPNARCQRLLQVRRVSRVESPSPARPEIPADDAARTRTGAVASGVGRIFGSWPARERSLLARSRKSLVASSFSGRLSGCCLGLLRCSTRSCSFLARSSNLNSVSSLAGRWSG